MCKKKERKTFLHFLKNFINKKYKEVYQLIYFKEIRERIFF